MFRRLVGRRFEAEFTVDQEASVAILADGESLRVLGSPALVSWMDHVAREAIREDLPEEYDSVSTLVNVRHTKAVAAGETVTVRASVIEVRERRVYFRVECLSAGESVGEGTHERYIIHAKRFLARVARRTG